MKSLSSIILLMIGLVMVNNLKKLRLQPLQRKVMCLGHINLTERLIKSSKMLEKTSPLLTEIKLLLNILRLDKVQDKRNHFYFRAFCSVAKMGLAIGKVTESSFLVDSVVNLVGWLYLSKIYRKIKMTGNSLKFIIEVHHC